MPLPEFYTLDQVAQRFGWTRRKLIARLKSYEIGTIGEGAEARLTDVEVQRLLSIEREKAEWNTLSQGQKISRGKRWIKSIRDEMRRDEIAALRALLPPEPPDPEMEKRFRKSMERSRRMRAAYARKKLLTLLGQG